MFVYTDDLLSVTPVRISRFVVADMSKVCAVRLMLKLVRCGYFRFVSSADRMSISMCEVESLIYSLCRLPVNLLVFYDVYNDA